MPRSGPRARACRPGALAAGRRGRAARCRAGPSSGSDATWIVRARSPAEMPVSMPSRASIETVNAVSYGDWLCETISRSPSSSQRSGVEREADQPAAVGGHEVDGLGRDELGGHAEVALVLTVGRIADHDQLAARDGRDGLFDRAERRAAELGVQEGSQSGVPWRSCYQRPFHGSRRSTYLAITSTSRLTGSPTSRAETVVDVHVCGISAISNPSSRSAATVRLIPATAIEPFSRDSA